MNKALESRVTAGAEPGGAAPIVEIDHLTKRFGNVKALDDVTLTIPRGSIVGLVGRNGSGKSTLLRHLTGLLLPTSGKVTTLGCPAVDLGEEELNQIGAVDQKISFLDGMTVGGHLQFVGGFYRRWDPELMTRLTELFELSRRKLASTLSGGDQQKLNLLLALCHRPKLLLLDEPLSALDPIVRERTLDYLQGLAIDGDTTIVISSHILRDIEKIVDWVICLDHGRLTEAGPLDEIQERHAEWVVIPATSPGRRVGPDLPERFDEPFVLQQSVDGAEAHLEVRDAAGELEAFQKRHQVQVEVRPLSTERLFLSLLKTRS